MYRPIIFILLFSVSAWGTSWGIVQRQYGTKYSVSCYSGGKEIFKEDSISEFVKPSSESTTWTFIMRNKKAQVHVDGQCVVYELDKNSTYKNSNPNSIEISNQNSSESSDKDSDLIIQEDDGKNTSKPYQHGEIFIPKQDEPTKTEISK